MASRSPLFVSIAEAAFLAGVDTRAGAAQATSVSQKSNRQKLR